MTNAAATATLPSDIEAFRYSHPTLDNYSEKVLADLGDGSKIIQQRIQFEIFAFDTGDPALGGEIIFNVRGIKNDLAGKKLPIHMYLAELDKDWAEHVRAKGGVELDHMARLSPADLARPGIAVRWPESGYTTLIDGNNRLVRRWDDGLRTFRFALLPIGEWLEPHMCKPGEEDRFADQLAPPDRREKVLLHKSSMRHNFRK